MRLRDASLAQPDGDARSGVALRLFNEGTSGCKVCFRFPRLVSPGGQATIVQLREEMPRGIRPFVRTTRCTTEFETVTYGIAKDCRQRAGFDASSYHS